MLAAWLLSVCHVVLVVSERAVDTELLRLVLAAEKVKRGLPEPFVSAADVAVPSMNYAADIGMFSVLSLSISTDSLVICVSIFLSFFLSLSLRLSPHISVMCFFVH